MKTLTRREWIQWAAASAAMSACGDDDGSAADGGVGERDGGRDGGPADAGADSGSDAAEPLPEPENPWGIATSHSRSLGLDWLAPMAAAGFDSLRGYDRGNPETSLDDAEAEGFSVTGILQLGGSFPADDLDAWEARVRELVEGAAGRVRQWEVWNEPPNFSEGGSPEEYAAIVVRAHDVVKSIDPTLEVGLCAASVHLHFMEQALLAGAAGHFDYVTLHPYETLGTVDQGFEALFLSIVPTVRKMLRASSPAQAAAPVIYTEIGMPVSESLNEEDQADAFLKSYVLSLAGGVTRVHWFEGIDGDSGPFGLLAGDGTERLAHRAAATLIEVLGPRPRYLGWVRLDGQPRGYVFEGATGPAMVAWPVPGETLSLGVETGEVVLDPRTGDPIGGDAGTISAPRIVTGLAGDRVDEAVLNRDTVYPWGGTFDDAAAVTYAPDAEQGLHPLRPAVPVELAGETVRGAAAGHAFAVDPAFLSYDTVPVRVRAEVRRLGEESAGFNLKYESTSGIGSRGWNSVPAEWTTLEWDLDDVRFVGKWGYHLTLDSDSTTNSGYALRSLTVEKR